MSKRRLKNFPFKSSFSVNNYYVSRNGVIHIDDDDEMHQDLEEVTLLPSLESSSPPQDSVSNETDNSFFDESPSSRSPRNGAQRPSRSRIYTIDPEEFIERSCDSILSCFEKEKPRFRGKKRTLSEVKDVVIDIMKQIVTFSKEEKKALKIHLFPPVIPNEVEVVEPTHKKAKRNTSTSRDNDKNHENSSPKMKPNSIPTNDSLNVIPIPLWENIFGLLQIRYGSKEKTFLNARLSCRFFRNIISKFWKQHVPVALLDSYFSRCTFFQFFPRSIFIVPGKKIRLTKPKPFSALHKSPPTVQEIRFHPKLSIENADLDCLPSHLLKLDISGCKQITNDGLKHLPSSLQFLNIQGCNKISWEGLKTLPVNIQFNFKDIKCSLLMQALLSEDLDSAKSFIERGANVNQLCLKEGKTVLYVACEKGNLEFIKLLIESGANLNQVTVDFGETPLYTACKNGNLNIVKELINNGANVNQPKKDKTTPLFIACQEGHLDIVKELINGGADLNQTIDGGVTPLFIACECGYLEIVKVLFENGANINHSMSSNQATPLYIAAQNGYLELVKFLINNGANLNQAISGGVTPLFIACQIQRIDIVKHLINNGANVNQTTIDNGEAPLFIASQNGRLDLVKFLVNSGANINQGRTNDGTTPLHIAAQYGHLLVVKFLLENGANINEVTTDFGTTPLFLACLLGHLPVIKHLISVDANVNLGTSDTGMTPLYIVTQNGNLEIVKMLIEKGADPNVVCTHMNDFQLIRGEDLSINSKYSFTPIYIAWLMNRTDIVTYLQPRSDIDLNINLARKNKNPQALNFFQSLLNQ